MPLRLETRILGGHFPGGRPTSGRSDKTCTCRMIPSGGSAAIVLCGVHPVQSRIGMVEAQLAACTHRAADTPMHGRTFVAPVCHPAWGRRPRAPRRAPSGSSSPNHYARTAARGPTGPMRGETRRLDPRLVTRRRLRWSDSEGWCSQISSHGTPRVIIPSRLRN